LELVSMSALSSTWRNSWQKSKQKKQPHNFGFFE
jgi:hypothetical protein